MPEHAVILKFTYPSRDLSALFELEEQLIAAIDAAEVGEYDGNEVAEDSTDASIYMYGPNGDRLFEAILPVLAAATWIPNGVARVRYGPPKKGVREKEVRIGS